MSRTGNPNKKRMVTRMMTGGINVGPGSNSRRGRHQFNVDLGNFKDVYNKLELAARKYAFNDKELKNKTFTLNFYKEKVIFNYIKKKGFKSVLYKDLYKYYQ